MSPLITLEHVEKIFTDEEVPTHVLRGISFTINKGEFVSVMGPSGSGKSTLLHILGFLDTPTKGIYTFAGRDINHYSEDERATIRNDDIGFIFQTFNLLPRMSALQNVMMPLLYSRIPEIEWEARAKSALTSVGLSHRLEYEPPKLSGGERQRVAIARSLVCDPKVIFADEPTGNLDSKSGGQVMEILDDLHTAGRTIILITHETYTAQFAERIIRIRDGLVESDEKVVARNGGKTLQK